MLKKYLAIVFLSLCTLHSGCVCDDGLNLSIGDEENASEIGSQLGDHNDHAGDFSDDQKPSEFILFSGAPDYEEIDDPVLYDYNDYWYEHDDDDDDDHDFDHGHHHVWWHHFYHHGEPHLPFPLFPPFYVHRRPLRHACDRWPFVCRSTYEVIRWLQCYHEFLDRHGGPGVVPVVHAWKK